MYSVLPWFGICCLGMALGKLVLKDRRRAFRMALYSGVGCLFLFGAARTLGGFGNIHPPEPGVIGFLNLTKYPPSLTFTLLMLGLNLLLLSGFERFGPNLRVWGKPLMTFGTSPLFFYVLHMYVFAGLSFLFPSGAGFLTLYVFWVLVLLMLFPLCRWYGGFKRKTSPDSVWRFF